MRPGCYKVTVSCTTCLKQFFTLSAVMQAMAVNSAAAGSAGFGATGNGAGLVVGSSYGAGMRQMEPRQGIEKVRPPQPFVRTAPAAIKRCTTSR